MVMEYTRYFFLSLSQFEHLAFWAVHAHNINSCSRLPLAHAYFLLSRIGWAQKFRSLPFIGFCFVTLWRFPRRKKTAKKQTSMLYISAGNRTSDISSTWMLGSPVEHLSGAHWCVRLCGVNFTNMRFVCASRASEDVSC